MQNNYDPFRSTRLIMRNRQYVKQYLGKPITLAIPIVILAVAVISGFMSFVVFAIGMGEWLADVGSWMSQDTGVDFTFNVSPSSLSLMTIVMCVAMFIIHSKSKNQDPSSMPNGGVTTFWVWSIITLVQDIISCVVLVFVPIIFGAIFSLAFNRMAYVGETSGPEGGIIALAIGLLFFVFAIMIFVILFKSINRFRFASSIRKSITTEDLTSKGAVPYAVMNIITAVFGVIGNAIAFGFIGVLNEYWSELMQGGAGYTDIPVLPESFMSIMGISLVASTLSLLEPVLMGVFALGYSKHIKAAGVGGSNLPMPEYQQTAPVQTAYQPAAPVETVNPYAAPAVNPIPPVEVAAPELGAPVVENESEPVAQPEVATPVETASAEETPEEAFSAETAPDEETNA